MYDLNGTMLMRHYFFEMIEEYHRARHRHDGSTCPEVLRVINVIFSILDI
jgi:hypothetical protein